MLEKAELHKIIIWKVAPLREVKTVAIKFCRPTREAYHVCVLIITESYYQNELGEEDEPPN